MNSLRELEEVNTSINQCPYKSEVGDDWQPITADGGDCDSYAVAKFRELVRRGFPTETLRLAVCWVETGEYHCVLLVDFIGQTWVLDNRYHYPMKYQDVPYKWHKLQITGTQEWEFV
jgi:predicted transglutaminase-like cysteine proteinase